MSEEKKYTYALFQETNGEEGESHYIFIRYQGNEDVLAHLLKQLNSIQQWTLEDDLSVFDLETDFLVSETTAKEMTKVDINSYFHRKFNGKMQKIHLGFKDSDSDHKKMKKAFKVLGYGSIQDFLSEEDLDPEDRLQLENQSSESSDSSENDSSSSSSSSEEENEKKGKLPGVTKKIEIPRYAAVKKRRH
jgi:hypothetical protein